MDPNFAIAHYELGQAYEQKNMHNEAIEEFQRATQLSGDTEIFNANLADAYATSVRREEVLKMVMRLPPRPTATCCAGWRRWSTGILLRMAANIALIYVGLGDRDQPSSDH